MIYDCHSSTGLLAMSKIYFLLHFTSSFVCSSIRLRKAFLYSVVIFRLPVYLALPPHQSIDTLFIQSLAVMLLTQRKLSGPQQHASQAFPTSPSRFTFFLLLMIAFITPAFMFVHTEYQHFSATPLTSIRSPAFLHQLKREQLPATLKNAALSQSLRENNFKSRNKARRRLH